MQRCGNDGWIGILWKEKSFLVRCRLNRSGTCPDWRMMIRIEKSCVHHHRWLVFHFYLYKTSRPPRILYSTSYSTYSPPIDRHKRREKETLEISQHRPNGILFFPFLSIYSLRLVLSLPYVSGSALFRFSGSEPIQLGGEKGEGRTESLSLRDGTALRCKNSTVSFSIKEKWFPI